jgi:hypothetical protein
VCHWVVVKEVGNVSRGCFKLYKHKVILPQLLPSLITMTLKIDVKPSVVTLDSNPSIWKVEAGRS